MKHFVKLLKNSRCCITCIQFVEIWNNMLQFIVVKIRNFNYTSSFNYLPNEFHMFMFTFDTL